MTRPKKAKRQLAVVADALNIDVVVVVDVADVVGADDVDDDDAVG